MAAASSLLNVLLCRHGETHDNVAQRTQGHAHGALTDVGKAQAAALVRVRCFALLRGARRSRVLPRSPPTFAKRRHGSQTRASTRCCAPTFTAQPRRFKSWRAAHA
jgi:hypothetical protein